MQRILEVIVRPNGATSVQTKGFSGDACLKASKFLEEALGLAVTERKTAEFYQSAQNQQHVAQS